MSSILASLLPAYAVAFGIVAVSLLDASWQNTPDAWTVVMHVSGGIAGLDREIQLASTGAFTATDRRRRMSTVGSMPAALLAELGAVISKVTAAASRRDPACRDCLVYRFEIKRATAALTAEFDDLSVGGTPFEVLAKTLTTQLTEALRQ